MPRKLIFFILAITLFSLTIRIYRINEPNSYYFDEVYHVVTARAYSQNNPSAYDPFAPPPEPDTAFDWLHPPLAKLIQAGSIKIFGDNSVSWRLPSALFGTAIIPATFFLAYILFGSWTAIFSATVIAFENMNLAMSRITMNDVFVTFFIVCAFTFTSLYIKYGKTKDIILTSVFLGLALSSKWTGLYAIGVIFLFIFFFHLRGVLLATARLHLGGVIVKLLLLILFPFLLYIAAYGQFWLQGHTTGQFIDLHKQIWWYQNRADLKHTYGSNALFCVPEGLAGPKTWCPWVLDMRPVYFSYEQYGEKAGYIYSLGNPIVFWIGLLSVSYILGKFIEERKKEYLLVLLGYFIFWVPWIFSPRILFMHHYLPSIPFLAISLGLTLSFMKKVSKLAVVLVIFMIIFAFFYFYPITAGYPIDPDAIGKFMWLKTWR